MKKSIRYPEAGAKLYDTIRSSLPAAAVQKVDSTDALERSLARPGGRTGATLLVFLAEGVRDLLDLHRLENLLIDIPLILVLPDQSEECLAIGHSLYPRFVSYMDEDFGGLSQVIGKIFVLGEAVSSSCAADGTTCLDDNE